MNPSALESQLEDYIMVDRLLTGLPAQQKGTTARWYSNKTSLVLGIQIDPLPCLHFLQVCGDVDYTCEIGQCSP